MAFRADEVARELAALRERMNRLFDESMASRDADAPAWIPPADVYLLGHNIILTLELPGVGKNAIEVSTEERAVRVRGHRLPAQAGDLGPLQLERSYGAFDRHFPLPAGARTAERKVHLEAGVLRIEIPIGEP